MVVLALVVVAVGCSSAAAGGLILLVLPADLFQGHNLILSLPAHVIYSSLDKMNTKQANAATRIVCDAWTRLPSHFVPVRKKTVRSVPVMALSIYR